VHDDQEAIYILEGTGTASVGGEQFAVWPGTAFFRGPQDAAYDQARPRQPAGEGIVDARSDMTMFDLRCSMFDVTAGVPPATGNPPEVAVRRVGRQPASTSNIDNRTSKIHRSN